MNGKHTLPADIERTSMAIITQELAAAGIELPPQHAAVVKRVILSLIHISEPTRP